VNAKANLRTRVIVMYLHLLLQGVACKNRLVLGVIKDTFIQKYVSNTVAISRISTLDGIHIK
jgi:hypothetical protein